MAQDGQIRYQVGFDVNTASLNKVKQAFAEIQQLTNRSFSAAQNKAWADSGTSLTKLKNDAAQLESAMNKAFDKNTGLVDFNKMTQSLGGLDKFRQVANSMGQLGTVGQNGMLGLVRSMSSFRLEATKSRSVLDGFMAGLKQVASYQLNIRIFQGLIGEVQKAWRYVQDLDESLNNIRIVTGKSSEQMTKFAASATKAAKQLGSSTTAYTDAALLYYQQGLSDQQVKVRTNVTMQVANITGQSTDRVSQQLTAVWNGYQVGVEQAESYVDKLAAVSANSAANLQELATGMSKVASSANAMGVDVDQLNAQLATIVSVTRQAPQTVGTAMKTIYARMSSISTDAQGAEVSLGSYTSKMAQMGVNVLDSSGSLRDMGDVIEEVGGKWSTYSREQQIALAQTMAGTRQYNNMIALFDNWEQYQGLSDISKNSQGTLQKQQATYMESIEAHLNQLSAAGQGIFNNFFQTDTINEFIDGLTKIVDLFGEITKGMGGLGKLQFNGGGVINTIVAPLLANMGIDKMADQIGMKQADKAAKQRNEERIKLAQKNAERLKQEEKILPQDAKKATEDYSRARAMAKSKLVSSETVNRINEKIDATVSAKQRAKTAKDAKTQAFNEAKELDKAREKARDKINKQADKNPALSKWTDTNIEPPDLSAISRAYRELADDVEKSMNKVQQASASLGKMDIASSALWIKDIEGVSEASQKTASKELDKVVKDSLKEMSESDDSNTPDALKKSLTDSKSEMRKKALDRLKLMPEFDAAKAEAAVNKYFEYLQEKMKAFGENANASTMLQGITISPQMLQQANEYLQKMKELQATVGDQGSAAAMQGDIKEISGLIKTMETGTGEDRQRAKQAFAEMQKRATQNVTTTGGQSRTNLRNAAQSMDEAQTESSDADNAVEEADIELNTEEQNAKTEKLVNTLKNLGQVASSAYSLYNSGLSLANTLQDETLTGSQKIKQGIGSLITIFPMAISGATALSNVISTMGLSNPVALAIAGAAMLATTLWPVVAAMIATESELQKAQKNAKNAEAAFKGASQAQESVAESAKLAQSALSDYKEAETALDKLTQGSLEWKDALVEVAETAEKLIDMFPDLSEYMTFKNGSWRISEQGQDQAQRRIDSATYLAAGVKNAAQVVSQVTETSEEVMARKTKYDENMKGSGYSNILRSTLTTSQLLNYGITPQLFDALSLGYYRGGSNFGSGFDNQGNLIFDNNNLDYMNMLTAIAKSVLGLSDEAKITFTNDGTVEVDGKQISTEDYNEFARAVRSVRQTKYIRLDGTNQHAIATFADVDNYWNDQNNPYAGISNQAYQSSTTAAYQLLNSDTFGSTTFRTLDSNMQDVTAQILGRNFSEQILQYYEDNEIDDNWNTWIADTGKTYSFNQNSSMSEIANKYISTFYKDVYDYLSADGSIIKVKNKITGQEQEINVGNEKSLKALFMATDNLVNVSDQKIAEIAQYVQDLADTLGINITAAGTLIANRGTIDWSSSTIKEYQSYSNKINNVAEQIKDNNTVTWRQIESLGIFDEGTIQLLQQMGVDAVEFWAAIRQNQKSFESQIADINNEATNYNTNNNVTANEINGLYEIATKQNWTLTDYKSAAKFLNTASSKTGLQNNIDTYLTYFDKFGMNWITALTSVDWTLPESEIQALLLEWATNNAPQMLDAFNDPEIWKQFFSVGMGMYLTTNTDTKQLNTNYANSQKVTKNLKFGDTISADDYAKLGATAKQYFAIMADGTYKLLADAELVKNAEQELYRTQLRNKLKLLKQEEKTANQLSKAMIPNIVTPAKYGNTSNTANAVGTTVNNASISNIPSPPTSTGNSGLQMNEDTELSKYSRMIDPQAPVDPIGVDSKDLATILGLKLFDGSTNSIIDGINKDLYTLIQSDFQSGRFFSSDYYYKNYLDQLTSAGYTVIRTSDIDEELLFTASRDVTTGLYGNLTQEYTTVSQLQADSMDKYVLMPTADLQSAKDNAETDIKIWNADILKFWRVQADAQLRLNGVKSSIDEKQLEQAEIKAELTEVQSELFSLKNATPTTDAILNGVISPQDYFTFMQNLQDAGYDQSRLDQMGQFIQTYKDILPTNGTPLSEFFDSTDDATAALTDFTKVMYYLYELYDGNHSYTNSTNLGFLSNGTLSYNGKLTDTLGLDWNIVEEDGKEIIQEWWPFFKAIDEEKEVNSNQLSYDDFMIAFMNSGAYKQYLIPFLAQTDKLTEDVTQLTDFGKKWFSALNIDENTALLYLGYGMTSGISLSPQYDQAKQEYLNHSFSSGDDDIFKQMIQYMPNLVQATMANSSPILMSSLLTEWTNYLKRTGLQTTKQTLNDELNTVNNTLLDLEAQETDLTATINQKDNYDSDRTFKFSNSLYRPATIDPSTTKITEANFSIPQTPEGAHSLLFNQFVVGFGQSSETWLENYNENPTKTISDYNTLASGYNFLLSNAKDFFNDTIKIDFLDNDNDETINQVCAGLEQQQAILISVKTSSNEVIQAAADTLYDGNQQLLLAIKNYAYNSPSTSDKAAFDNISGYSLSFDAVNILSWYNSIFESLPVAVQGLIDKWIKEQLSTATEADFSDYLESTVQPIQQQYELGAIYRNSIIAWLSTMNNGTAKYLKQQIFTAGAQKTLSGWSKYEDLLQQAFNKEQILYFMQQAPSLLGGIYTDLIQNTDGQLHKAWTEIQNYINSIEINKDIPIDSINEIGEYFSIAQNDQESNDDYAIRVMSYLGTGVNLPGKDFTAAVMADRYSKVEFIKSLSEQYGYDAKAAQDVQGWYQDFITNNNANGNLGKIDEAYTKAVDAIKNARSNISTFGKKISELYDQMASTATDLADLAIMLREGDIDLQAYAKAGVALAVQNNSWEELAGILNVVSTGIDLQLQSEAMKNHNYNLKTASGRTSAKKELEQVEIVGRSDNNANFATQMALVDDKTRVGGDFDYAKNHTVEAYIKQATKLNAALNQTDLTQTERAAINAQLDYISALKQVQDYYTLQSWDDINATNAGAAKALYDSALSSFDNSTKEIITQWLAIDEAQLNTINDATKLAEAFASGDEQANDILNTMRQIAELANSISNGMTLSGITDSTSYLHLIEYYQELLQFKAGEGADISKEGATYALEASLNAAAGKQALLNNLDTYDALFDDKKTNTFVNGQLDEPWVSQNAGSAWQMATQAASATGYYVDLNFTTWMREYGENSGKSYMQAYIDAIKNGQKDVQQAILTELETKQVEVAIDVKIKNETLREQLKESIKTIQASLKDIKVGVKIEDQKLKAQLIALAQHMGVDFVENLFGVKMSGTGIQTGTKYAIEGEEAQQAFATTDAGKAIKQDAANKFAGKELGNITQFILDENNRVIGYTIEVDGVETVVEEITGVKEIVDDLDGQQANTSVETETPALEIQEKPVTGQVDFVGSDGASYSVKQSGAFKFITNGDSSKIDIDKTGDKDAGIDSPGGGGGGGGGDKKGTEKKHQHAKVFQDVDKSIQDLTHQLTMLDKAENRLMGADYTSNLQKQLDILKQQVKVYNDKLQLIDKQIKREQDYQKTLLTSDGVGSQLYQRLGISDEVYKQYEKKSKKGKKDSINYTGILDEGLKYIQQLWAGYDGTNYGQIDDKVKEYLDETVFNLLGGDSMDETATAIWELIIKGSTAVSQTVDHILQLQQQQQQVEEKILDQAYSIIDTQIQALTAAATLMDKIATFQQSFESFEEKLLGDTSSAINKALSALLKSELFDTKTLGQYMKVVDTSAAILQFMSDDGIKDDDGYILLEKATEKYGSEIVDLFKSTYGADLGDGRWAFDQSQAWEKATEYLQKIMTSITDLLSSYQSSLEAMSDALSNLYTAMQNVVEDLEKIADQYDHDKKLVKLLFGDKSYELQNKYLAQQIQANIKVVQKNSQIMETAGANAKKYAAAMNEAYANMTQYRNQINEIEKTPEASRTTQQNQALATAKAKYAQASYEYSTYKTMYESSRQQYMTALSSKNSTIEQTIELIYEFYKNTIDQIAYDFERKITDLGLQWASSEWQQIVANPFNAYDAVDSAYAIESLRLKFLKAINDTDNEKAQRRYTELMDTQLGLLNEQTQVYKDQVEYIEKMLTLEQARVALEQAQQNKSTMRLRRDSQGNYTYQYVANEDDILSKQEALLKAEQDLYDTALKAAQSVITNNLKTYSDYLTKLKAIFEDKSLTTEDRQKEVNSLNQIYGDKLTQGFEAWGAVRSNLLQAAGISKDALNLSDLFAAGGTVSYLLSERDASAIDMMDRIASILQSGDVDSISELLSMNLSDLMGEAYNDILSLDENSMLYQALEQMGVDIESLKAGNGSDPTVYEMLQWFADTDASQQDKAQQQLQQIIAITQEIKNKLANIEALLAQVFDKKQSLYLIGDKWVTDITQSTTATTEAVKERQNLTLTQNIMESWTAKMSAIYSGKGWDVSGQASGDGYKIENTQKFDTGGYTGEWGSDGKIAMLHQKEIVLNKTDTKNMLDAVNVVRQLEGITLFDEMNRMMDLLNAEDNFAETTNQTIEQDVHIQANFPNVSSASEIEEALNNLVSIAAQRAMTRK